MKNYIQKYICKSATLFVGASLMLTGCSESFLDPDPQTMFEPETVFSTEMVSNPYWLFVTVNLNVIM